MTPILMDVDTASTLVVNEFNAMSENSAGPDRSVRSAASTSNSLKILINFRVQRVPSRLANHEGYLRSDLFPSEGMANFIIENCRSNED